MTDEEMAEEWVKQEYPTLQITAVAQRYIKAFLAGLKAGRPEWHDLRKDPKDLPKDLRYVWTNIGSGYYDTDGIWWDDFGRLQGVVAWCEPKFKE